MSSIQTVKNTMISAYLAGDLASFRDPGKFSPEDALSPDYPYVKDAGGLSFADIDYTSTDRSAWNNPQHLARLFILSKNWYKMEEGDGKEALFSRVILPLLDHWLEKDYKSPNWWYNEICIPSQFGQIGLFLFDRLDENRQARFLEIAGRGSFGPRPELMTRWTGANLLWFAFATMEYAVITNDADLLKRTVGRAGEEIAFGDEGIRKDGSFFQHGPRLYSCGYGISFAMTLADAVSVLGDTEFQFPKERLSVFLFHLLDGIRYMTQGADIDYCANGREYTRRHNHTTSGRQIPRILRLLSRVPGIPRGDEIADYLAAMTQGRPPVAGIRVFKDAMFMTSHVGGIYISVRGVRPGLFDEEICNSEGILGYNLSYGTHTTVMERGDEYRDMSAFWDYARMPGTTARYETDEQLSAKPDFTNRAVSGRAFGCDTVGDCGYIVMDFTRETVSGKFAALATPFGTVLLGRDFHDSENVPLYTTAEQCRLRGDISLSEDGRIFRHGNVAYTMLDRDCAFSYTAKETHGNFHRNNLAESDEDVVAEVLTLSVERPADHPHYAYVICPAEYADAFTLSDFSGDGAALTLPDGRTLCVSFTEGKAFMK